MYKHLVLRLARIFGEFQECNDDLICCKTNIFKPRSNSLFEHVGAEFSIHHIVIHYNLPSYFGLTTESPCLHPSSSRRLVR